MPVKVEKSEPFLITFRSHHNAYQEGSGAQIIRYPEVNTLWSKICQIVVGMVVIHYFLWFIPMVLSLYLFYSWGYPVVSVALLALYIPTYFNKDELKFGRPWEWFRQHSFWKHLQHYGQLEIVRECELDPDRKYIFGYHPHGILILSRISSYGGVFETIFPGIEQRCLAATPMFLVPGSREICLWMGAVRADRSNAVRILNTDKLNLLLYPGGSDEIFLTDPASTTTTIIARRGFIRLALQQGVDLVPSFVFGEKHAYRKLDIPESIKSFFMKNLRTPLIIFWGRFFSWLPLSSKKIFLSVVHGKPIRVETMIPDPTDEQIDELYTQFYAEIRNLYNKYKGKYGYDENETLVIREATDKSSKANVSNGVTNAKSLSKKVLSSTNNGTNGVQNGFGH